MRWILAAMLMAGVTRAQPRAAIEKYITDHQGPILREFVELLNIPNVAADRANIRRNAEFLRAMLARRGFHSEVLETSGNPLVYGERKGAGPAVLYYIHYD